eukprot:11158719-Lingulodinium_polyedra.AAC.1
MKTEISSAPISGGRSGRRKPSVGKSQSGRGIRPLSSRASRSSWLSCSDLNLPSAQLATASSA